MLVLVLILNEANEKSYGFLIRSRFDSAPSLLILILILILILYLILILFLILILILT